MKKEIKDLLVEELEIKKSKNSQYSIRAFARDLGINRTTLALVMEGKREISVRNLTLLKKHFSLTEQDIYNHQSKINSRKRLNDSDFELLKDDEFHLISDWYYFAILNLAKIENNQASSPWISERLGIDKDAVERALEVLVRRGHILIREGRLMRSSKSLTTQTEIPSLAIKNHHQGVLREAEKSLYRDELKDREFSSVTMAIDAKKMDKAKDLIKDFKRKLSKLMEVETPSSVYCLAVNLFPLSKDCE